MTSPERAELTGALIDGQYRVGSCIGIGGTGEVFEARRTWDGATVALKTLRPCFVTHPDLATRLRREAEVASAVVHPGIVPVFAQGTLADGSPYLVMERVSGDSLARLLMREQTISPAETATVGIRVAAILHAVHRAGYTHRDIKPEHVLLSRAINGELCVRLLDFGVCASPTAPPDEKQRELGRVYGTPTYVSPEQAAGNPDVDGRADIFSLGIVVFECLTGRVPFRASNVATLLLRILKEDAPRVGLLAPDVDLGLDEVVAKLLARDVADRYPDARSVGRALAPWARNRRDIERRIAQRLSPMRRATPSDAPTAAETPSRAFAAA